MTSETDSVLRHVHVDGQQAGLPSDGGGGTTHAGRADDSASTPTCFQRRTADEFLYAMKEDIGDWLGAVHGVDVGADEFFERLETGVLLCRHANAVHDRLCHGARREHDTDDLSKLPNRPLQGIAHSPAPYYVEFSV